MKKLSSLILCLVLLTGCGSSYESENLEEATLITDLSDVLTVTDVRHDSYCASDTCWLGDDGTITTIDLELLVSMDTAIAALEDEFRAGPSLTRLDCEAEEADCEGDTVLLIGELRLALKEDRTGLLLVDAATG